MPIEYAIIVKGKTRLEHLIERFNTKAQARFFINAAERSRVLAKSVDSVSSVGQQPMQLLKFDSGQQDEEEYAEYQEEHDMFHRALSTVQKELSPLIKTTVIERLATRQLGWGVCK